MKDELFYNHFNYYCINYFKYKIEKIDKFIILYKSGYNFYF